MGWDQETPLWYYVLKESEVQRNGDRLGEVGGRIVGEVLVDLLDHDPSSSAAGYGVGWACLSGNGMWLAGPEAYTPRPAKPVRGVVYNHRVALGCSDQLESPRWHALSCP